MEEKQVLRPEVFGDSPERIVESYLRQNISRNIYISDSKKAGMEYEYSIGIVKPVIFDDVNDRRVIKFIPLNDVFLTFYKDKKSNHTISSPKRKDISMRVESRLATIKKDVENYLLDKTHKKLIQIPQVETALNPLREIIENLLMDHTINYLALKKMRGNKTEKYLELLRRLEFVSMNHGVISEGAKLIELSKQIHGGTKNVSEEALGLAVKEELYYIEETMQIRTLSGFVRYAKAFYSESLFFGEEYRIREAGLRRRLKNFYGISAEQVKFKSRIERLVDVDILGRDNDFIIENREIGDGLRNNIILQATPRF